MATSWFPHDATASTDAKILRLRSKYGWQGYGIYFATLEWMWQNADATIQEDDLEPLALFLGKRKDFIERMMEFFVRTGLLQKRNGTFSSIRLSEEKKKELEKSAKARRAVEIRESKRSSNDSSDDTSGDHPTTHPPNQPTNNTVVGEKSLKRWLNQNGKGDGYGKWLAKEYGPVLNVAWQKVLAGRQVSSPGEFVELCKALSKE